MKFPIGSFGRLARDDADANIAGMEQRRAMFAERATPPDKFTTVVMKSPRQDK